MRRQAVRTTALALGVLIAAAPSVRAGTITIGDVVRAAEAGAQMRTAAEVRLRMGGGQSGTAQSASTQTGTTSTQQTGTQQTAQQPSGAQAPSAPADPTLSQSGGHVETVDLGDVTGTVCDCGEIPKVPLPKAGFPWWPLLGGIPLICVSGICTGEHTPTCEESGTCSPPPTPPTTPTPEPATLLLLGSGLLAVGAGARRRRGLKKLSEKTMNATTEGV